MCPWRAPPSCSRRPFRAETSIRRRFLGVGRWSRGLEHELHRVEIERDAPRPEERVRDDARDAIAECALEGGRERSVDPQDVARAYVTQMEAIDPEHLEFHAA